MQKFTRFLLKNWVVTLTALVMVIAPLVATYVAYNSVHCQREFVARMGDAVLMLVTWNSPSVLSAIGFSLVAGLCLNLSIVLVRRISRAEDRASGCAKEIGWYALKGMTPIFLVTLSLYNVLLADSSEAWSVVPVIIAGFTAVAVVVCVALVIGVVITLAGVVRTVRRSLA